MALAVYGAAGLVCGSSSTLGWRISVGYLIFFGFRALGFRV